MYSQAKCDIRDNNSRRHRQNARNSLTTSSPAHTSVTSSEHSRTHTNNGLQI
jgi:hypothetical protein